MILSTLAKELPGSEILKISEQIKVRMAAGENIFNATIGDFDPKIFPIPKALENKIIKFYKAGYTNYPAAEGIKELRESIVAFTAHFQQLTYSPSEVLVGSGGRPLIYCAYKAIVDPGDTVLYPKPSWNNQYYVALTGAHSIEIPTTADDHFMPTAENIIPCLKDATLLCLCSPLNPSGTVFKREELEKICSAVIEENESRTASQKKLYVLYDQMYGLLTHGYTEHIDPVSICPEMKAYTIFIDAISKSFAATGVRVGWCLGPVGILTKMKAILSHIGAWSPMAEQNAVAEFLTETKSVNKFLNQFNTEIEERLLLIYQGIKKLKDLDLPVDVIKPQAAIYLSIYLDLPISDLLKAGIALLPFEAFGSPEHKGWYRLSVGTCKKEDIPELLFRLRNILIKTDNLVLLQ